MAHSEQIKGMYKVPHISKDYYKILGLSRNCSQEDVEKSYIESQKVDNNFDWDASVDYKLV